MTIIVTLVATIPFLVASQNSSSLEMLRLIQSLHQTLSGHSPKSLTSPSEKRGVHGPRGVYPLLYMASARDRVGLMIPNIIIEAEKNIN